MKLHPNELWLFFDCDEASHKKTRAHAYSITPHVNEFTFSNCKLTKRMWADILNMLHMQPKDLLNKSNPKYQKEFARHDFDEDGWLNILRNNPCMVKAPIAIMHGEAVLCVKPKDVLKLSRAQKEATA